MIIRAKRALPGMALSLLLSAPALAATPHDGATTEHKAGEAKSHSPRTEAKASTHRSALAARSSSKVAVSKPGSAAPRAHVASRAKGRDVVAPVSPNSSSRLIRRTSYTNRVGHTDSNLIDDGTLWREQGSMATWQQSGVASWYGGRRWQGHLTTSGARYDEHELTAAHATLPIGTKVRVVRQDGRGSVVVTINDRPGTRTRIIDLSREAAKELGILGAGVAMVTLQPM